MKGEASRIKLEDHYGNTKQGLMMAEEWVNKSEKVKEIREVIKRNENDISRYQKDVKDDENKILQAKQKLEKYWTRNRKREWSDLLSDEKELISDMKREGLSQEKPGNYKSELEKINARKKQFSGAPSAFDTLPIESELESKKRVLQDELSLKNRLEKNLEMAINEARARQKKFEEERAKMMQEHDKKRSAEKEAQKKWEERMMWKERTIRNNEEKTEDTELLFGSKTVENDIKREAKVNVKKEVKIAEPPRLAKEMEEAQKRMLNKQTKSAEAEKEAEDNLKRETIGKLRVERELAEQQLRTSKKEEKAAEEERIKQEKKEKFEKSFIGKAWGKTKAISASYSVGKDIKKVAGKVGASAAEHAKSGMPMIFFIFGLIIYSIDLVSGSNDLNVGMLVAAGSIFFIIIALTSLKNVQKGIQNSIFLLIAIAFEIGYYTLLTRFLGTIPWQLSRIMGWNGFLITAGISGFNQEKTHWKLLVYYFVLVLLLLILNPLTTALSQTFGWIPTTETGGGSKEDVLKGIQETGTGWLDEIKCATNPDPELCKIEAKWTRIREKDPELATEMKKLCENQDPDCDCYVYLGKQREDCFTKQEETDVTKTTAAEREGAQMTIDIKKLFEGNEYSGQKIMNGAWLIVNSPDKEIDITAKCVITGPDKEEVKSKLTDPSTPTIEGIKTEQIQMICESQEDVKPGKYEFNYHALAESITTKAEYVGLYTSPTMIRIIAENPTEFTRIKAQYDELKKGTYTNTKGEIIAESDNDISKLSIQIQPKRGGVLTELRGLSPIEEGTEYSLDIGMINNKKGSNVTQIKSLEMEIPPIFEPLCTGDQGNYNQLPSEDGKVKIKAKDTTLENINKDISRYANQGSIILGLRCDMKAKSNLANANQVNKLEFKAQITYQQDIIEKITITKR